MKPLLLPLLIVLVVAITAGGCGGSGACLSHAEAQSQIDAISVEFGAPQGDYESALSEVAAIQAKECE